MIIQELLTENIVRDYYTANIKAEVILGTILTPVIGEILTIIGRRNEQINGEMKLLAKEFPVLKSREIEREEKPSFLSYNADYLMCDKDSIYLVELKSRRESYDYAQMRNYLMYCSDEETFADRAGKNFVYLLNHVSKTGYSHKRWKEIWKETSEVKEGLKWLFEIIIRYSEERGRTAYPEIGWEEREHGHADRAVSYLRQSGGVSSKKYLFTAGQMLDNMKDNELWEKKIKLLYLMPGTAFQNKIPSDCIVVTFQEIMEQADAVCREMDKPDLIKYWNWVMNILVRCGLC